MSATSRPYEPGDEHAIVALYNRITRRRRTVEQHRWEWLEPPAGPSGMWVIEWSDGSSRRIIGHHGLLPLVVSVFGGPHLAGKTENTMVDPDFSHRLMYLRHEQAFAAEAAQRFDLFFTTSGSGVPAKVRKRLGYRAVGPYARFFKISGPSGVAHLLGRRTTARSAIWKRVARLAALAAGVVIRPFFNPAASVDNAIVLQEISRLESIADELRALWETSKAAFGVTLDRSPEYLDWRISRNPHVTYLFFAGRRHGTLAGYVVVERVPPHGCRIIDLVAEENRPEIAASLLHHTEKELARRGIGFIEFQTLRGNKPLEQTLRRRGFRDMDDFRWLSRRTTRELPQLLVRANTPDLDVLFDPANWYFTELFKEGLAEADRVRGGFDEL